MLNHDIITLICTELEYGQFSYLYRLSDADLRCRKALLSLGLASKDFLEPALNSLWKNINNLNPLLSVLPETTVVNGEKMILSQIAPSSWDRLQYYTNRVRTFNDDDLLVGPEESIVHESVYAYLGQKPPIFPNLRTLRLKHRLCSSNSSIFFLTSTLLDVQWPCRLGVSDAIADLGPSLSLLASKSPGLPCLMLSAHPYSGLASSLSRLRALETLAVSGVPDLGTEFIRVISSLLKLTTLSLTLPVGSLPDYTAVQGGFQSLTQLRLTGSNVNLANFFERVTLAALQALYVECDWERLDEDPPHAEIARVTRTLEGKFSSLQTLTVHTAGPLFLNNFDGLLLWSIFEPLLELRTLKLLRYSIPLSLTDQNTARIARAWPHLEELELTAVSWDGAIPTVDSLVYFAQYCPNLELLTYPIRLGSIPIEPASLIPPTLSLHPLRVFNCSLEADVLNPPTIALALHQIFPNLKRVYGAGNRWDEVQQILRSFHFLRAQNRQFEG
ncbi:hypothetical protein BDP27DRAFT_1336711 [Rhodocollybia butyracea]|uniref:F-box domain-containing protein n=1 Tax=Rhodocollybia butyracea TaxID=206335 RepID=A0A9P5PHU5_9AGAR|nr:hypothetical protein BDP27DRAFT_1336711 [Rhodocollybia butyracea]